MHLHQILNEWFHSNFNYFLLFCLTIITVFSVKKHLIFEWNPSPRFLFFFSLKKEHQITLLDLSNVCAKWVPPFDYLILTENQFFERVWLHHFSSIGQRFSQINFEESFALAAQRIHSFKFNQCFCACSAC